MNKKTSNEIVNKICALFPNLKSELNFSNNFELLVAVILSAQCTDKRVNLVTKELFKVANTPVQMLNLGEEKLATHIKSCGFYKTKAHNIIKASEQLLTNFNGEVPASIEELSTLKGVGRKTANVVMAEGFNLPGLAVDTHVFRVSNRLGLSCGKTPSQVETDLKEQFPKEDWKQTHLALLMFGRYICKARNPDCTNCEFKTYCKKFKEQK